MPEANRVNAALDPMVKQQILAKYAEIRQLITIGVITTPDDAKHVKYLGDEYLPFVTTFVARANQAPDLLPSHRPLAGVNVDNQTNTDLLDIERAGNDTTKFVRQTRQVAGAELLAAALDTQTTLKVQAKRGVAGAQDFYDDINSKYPKRGPAQPETPTPTPPTP
jgi:hypothetical protein